MKKIFYIKYKKNGVDGLMAIEADEKPTVEEFIPDKDTYNFIYSDGYAKLKKKHPRALQKKLPGFKDPGLN